MKTARPLILATGARRTGRNGWLQVRNAEASAGPVELLIYDQIGRDWFDNSGVAAADFAAELRAIPADREILVSINSPGGNVWDGLAIYHQLRARRDRVSIKVDGIAASIASIIALAGRELRIPANALYMIHDPSGLAMGTAEDMRKLADELDKHADVLASIYSEATGKPASAIRDMMRAETWFTGAEAVDAGFATEATDEIQLAASFDFSGFRNVPAALGKPNTQPPAATSRGRATPQHAMNRSQMIALLAGAGHDKASLEAMTDAQLSALVAKLQAATPTPTPTPTPAPAPAPAAVAPPAPTPTPAPAPAPVATAEELARLRAAVDAERGRRIRTEFAAIQASRPWLDSETWLPRALADEAILDNLRALPTIEPGTSPVLAIGAADLGNPVVEAYRALPVGAKRNEHRKQHLATLQRFAPRNSNTLAAALVTDWLADGLVIVANNKLGPLRGFSRDFSTDPMKPRATVQVRKATATSAAQTNPTNFETGDTTLAAIAVTVAQISKSFHVTNAELHQGHRLEYLAGINADTLANAISDVWTALVTSGNFGAGQVVGAASAFDIDDLKDLYGNIKNARSKTVLLDGAYMGRLLPANMESFRLGQAGAYGFDLMAEQNRWTGALANTVGFGCSPDAIAVASGLPMEAPAGEFLSIQDVTIPGLELTVRISTWYSRGSRAYWASYDVMFGAAVGDTSAAKILISA